MAGEFGHVALVEDGLECRCGNRGCWEVYASNSAAARYYAESTSRPRKSRNGSRRAARNVQFEDLLSLSVQGDSKAREAVNRKAQQLGRGSALLITGLAPDRTEERRVGEEGRI